MRFIEKQSEPRTLIEFKQLANPPDWMPTFEGLPGERKKALKEALIREQKGLCCYCECKLAFSDSHIEHFRPQSTDSKLALDYGNMHCSCMADNRESAPLTCGMAKRDWFDENLLISPLTPNCESRFRYNAEGRMTPASEGDAAAKETIAHLRLDSPKLNRARKAVIDCFFDERTMTDQERTEMVKDYVERDSFETPSPFISAVKCVMRDWMAS